MLLEGARYVTHSHDPTSSLGITAFFERPPTAMGVERVSDMPILAEE